MDEKTDVKRAAVAELCSSAPHPAEGVNTPFGATNTVLLVKGVKVFLQP